MDLQRKIDEILSHYTEEVKALYGIDSMFTSCVQAMARGVSPHKVIGSFVLCHIQMNKQMVEMTMLLPPRGIVIEDKSKFIKDPYNKES